MGMRFWERSVAPTYRFDLDLDLVEEERLALLGYSVIVYIYPNDT